jgi:hypothetical protein
MLMDAIDTIGFLGWSALLYGIADINGWDLLGCQACWLTLAFVGRKLIDVRFERREAE